MKVSFLIIISLVLASELCALEISVVNSNDSGPGSLRDAIQQANTAAPGTTITFNIPGSGVHVIQPLTALPDITNSMAINGYSQPGSSPNTLVQSDNAVILIEITTNLNLRASSLVRGLSIPFISLSSDNCTLQGNFIGVDPSGTKKLPNNYGVYLFSSFAHVIGGTDPADRNLIASDSQAIAGFGAPNPLAPTPDFTVIQGNYIGTDKTGAAPLGAKGSGIAIVEMLQIIGGTEPGAGNVIAFNGGTGVRLGGRAKYVQILGNSIFSNGGPGIDGGDPGPTVTRADPGSTTVQGSFTGAPGLQYRVEIFLNHGCDPSGFGEGEKFIGFGLFKTDATGYGTFSATVAPPVAAGDVLTATVTANDPSVDPYGPSTTDFSRCVVAGPPVDLGIIASSASPVSALSNFDISVTITNNSPAPASGVLVIASLPDNVNFISGAPGWTNASGQTTFFLPSLGPGAAVSTTLTLQPQRIGSLITSVQVVGDQIDMNQANNHAGVTTTVFNAAPKQFVVTNPGASGAGTFEEALNEVQRGAGGDTIAFNIPGAGVHTIAGTFYNSNLPVIIDGYTQPGSAPNTLGTGDNAVLLIDFGQAELELGGGSSTVRGLVLPALFVNGTAGGEGANNLIEGCFIGTDPSGRAASTNVNQFGSPATEGIEITGADDTRIGGSAPASRNIISGNLLASDVKAAIRTDAARTVIQGNYIGVDASGSAPLGNNGAGIYFFGAVQAGGLVGGTNPGEGNVIAFNLGPGVVVGSGAFDVSVLGNSIYSNGGIGIAVDAQSPAPSSVPRTNSPYGLLSAPIITTVTGGPNLTRAQGYLQGLSNETYRVEFFSSPSNTNGFFQSEGRTFLGFVNIVTDSNGRAVFDKSFAASSELVSATATDSAGNTSSFFTFTPPPSRCFQTGDLLISFRQDGHIQWRGPDGRPISILLDEGTDTIPSLDFAPDGTLWATDATSGNLEHFGPCGQRLTPIVAGAGSAPVSMTFDSSGNAYVGFQQITNNLWKFDSSGHLLGKFTLTVGQLAVQAAELAADQRTLFYASGDPFIHRYDVATGQQLTPFATNLLSGVTMRIFPDGGVVAGDFGRFVRFGPNGNVIWSTNTQNKIWLKIKPELDGKTFWASGQTNLVRVDLATGALLQSLPVDLASVSFGLAIVGEYIPTFAGSVTLGPRLNISVSGAQGALSWSSSSTGFTLEYSPALGPLAIWQEVATKPVLQNGQNSVPISLGARAQFFRLIKP